jgi:hypothetical protein
VAIKPLDTAQLIGSLLGALKTAAIVFFMVLLEWYKTMAYREKLARKKSEDDLEIEKLKSKEDLRTDDKVIDDFLANRKSKRKG